VLSLASLSVSLHSLVMDSSQLTGDNAEECNSNESGWTMYLGSPVNSDDLKANGSKWSNVGSGCSNGRSKNDNMDYDDGDYDSLASDASTGPAQVKVLNGKEKKIHEKRDNSIEEQDSDEQDEQTKLPNNCDKKAGKMKKEEKTTRRSHNKRRSSCSSRTSFFR
jgi:hypothetical protein